MIRFAMILLAALTLTACDSSGFVANTENSNSELGLPGDVKEPEVPATPVCKADSEKLEAEMDALLAASGSEDDFSYEIERADGRKYTFNLDASTPETVYESASTSKMVTGLVILRLVEKGILKLSDRPQDYISNWPVPSTDSLSNMTLEHLLSFRSGLVAEPRCMNSKTALFEECVMEIAILNMGNGEIPGAQFNYSGAHMQIAGLMAIKASGKNNWTEVFDEYKAATGTFPTGLYDLPAATNPRLAGGMHWTGAEYLAFLRALKAGKLLNAEMMKTYLVDRTALPVTIGNSPAQAGIGEEWHYGLGYWHECKNATWNCEAAQRISSPGAYGAYPFWDVKYGYIGMLSIQTGVGGFRTGTGEIERLVTEKANEWATCE